jgi:hypothetical protein
MSAGRRTARRPSGVRRGGAARTKPRQPPPAGATARPAGSIRSSGSTSPDHSSPGPRWHRRGQPTHDPGLREGEAPSEPGPAPAARRRLGCSPPRTRSRGRSRALRGSAHSDNGSPPRSSSRSHPVRRLGRSPSAGSRPGRHPALHDPDRLARGPGVAAGPEGAGDAFDVPGGMDGAGDHELLDVIAGLEAFGPGVQPRVVSLFVLAGEDERSGAQAVLECIEPHLLSASMSAWTSGAGRVLAINLGASERGPGGDGHGRSPVYGKGTGKPHRSPKRLGAEGRGVAFNWLSSSPPSLLLTRIAEAQPTRADSLGGRERM